MGLSRPLGLLRLKTILVSSFGQSGRKTHAPAFRFNTYINYFGVNRQGHETQLNLVFVLEQKCLWCKLRRVLDHYFNVCLGVRGP